jgi:CBS domain-containing protein
MTEPHAPIDRPAPQPRLPDGSAADLAGREPLVLGPDDLVVDAARLMAAQRRSFVLVLDADRRALGVVTE